jgi:hypothetical protein
LSQRAEQIMNEPRTPSDPERAHNERERAPYEPPTLIEYGTLEDLTQGAFAPFGDDLFTGTQP